MTRTLRSILWHASLLTAYMAQNLKVRLSYRADFIVNFVTTLMYSVVQILFFWAIFKQVPEIRGWDLNEVLVIYGFSELSWGIFSVFGLRFIFMLPGTYIVEANMFADIVADWEDNRKVWAADPGAAQFRFIVGDGGTNWTRQNFGQRNTHNWTFTLEEPKTVKVGIWLRGKYAIANNGWFIDNLSLRRIE